VTRAFTLSLKLIFVPFFAFFRFFAVVAATLAVFLRLTANFFGVTFTLLRFGLAVRAGFEQLPETT
jgi:hypothetical protein